MTTEEFCNCLRSLKLSRASARSAAALGLSIRQLQRIAAGHAPVSPMLALLITAYQKRGGVPNPLWNPDLPKIDLIQRSTAELMAFETRRRGRP
jgi:hypothetical protein